MDEIKYAVENNLTVEEFKMILQESTLSARRPVDELDRLTQMLAHANLIITARLNGKLIGVSRSLTDFSFCTYLSDLAVHENYQKMGIGKALIRETKRVTPQAKLILLAAPKAVNYYPRIGMTRHDHCYYIDSIDELSE